MDKELPFYIPEKYRDIAISFDRYFEISETLSAEGQSSAPNDNPTLANYAKLNHARMKRLLKTAVLSPEMIESVQKITVPSCWYIITETWCGDAAQNIPWLELMARQNPLINTAYVFRDQNLELMDAFLTNGGRSIPKVIITDVGSHEVLGNWGPRPEPAQKLYMELKNLHENNYEPIVLEMQKWYNANEGADIQEEWVRLIPGWYDFQ